jgi:hypothetical protein
MERKAKATQDAVDVACDQPHTDYQTVTVNAVIGLTRCLLEPSLNN